MVFPVHLDVLGEVIRARETLVTQRARVRPDAGVRATVSGQLVGPREAPVAAGPRADERLLACVPAQVRLEVRTLAVRLVARRVRAAVQPLVGQLRQRRRRRRRARRRRRRDISVSGIEKSTSRPGRRPNETRDNGRRRSCGGQRRKSTAHFRRRAIDVLCRRTSGSRTGAHAPTVRRRRRLHVEPVSLAVAPRSRVSNAWNCKRPEVVRRDHVDIIILIAGYVVEKTGTIAQQMR